MKTNEKCKECKTEISRLSYCSKECRRKFNDRVVYAKRRKQRLEDKNRIRSLVESKKLVFPHIKGNEQKIALVDIGLNDSKRSRLTKDLQALSIQPFRIESTGRRHIVKAFTIKQIEEAILHYKSKWEYSLNLYHRGSMHKYISIRSVMLNYIKERKLVNLKI